MPSTSDQKTAVLVFAQSAQKEICDKGIPKSLELFDELNAHILTEVEKTRLPYFHLSEEFQFGNSFGERFVNAIQFIFDKGYQKVIIVGNDSPELKASHIKTALHALDNGKNALGPSKDGGFYLLGIDKISFKKEPFLLLPWQKQSLLLKIQDYFKLMGDNPLKLDYLEDIDSIADARSILQRFKTSISRKISTLLSALIEKHKDTFVTVPIFINPNAYGTYNLVRGSP